MPVNRVCTAKPNPEQRFICYDIAPDTDLTSYFDDYLAAVKSLPGCNNNGTTSIIDDYEENNLDSNITNCPLKGHRIPRTMIAPDIDIVEEYQSEGNFDPSVVAALAISTLLIDDRPPSDAPSASTPSTSSPNLSDWRSSIILATISVFPLILGAVNR